MIDTTMPKRAISVVLATMLACTLMPSASLAYATEGATNSVTAEDTTTNATNSEQTESANASQNAEASDQSGESGNTSRPEIIAESHKIEQNQSADSAKGVANSANSESANNTNSAANTNSAEDPNSTPQSSAVEMVYASVPLDQKAGALFSYNGLTYEIDSANAGKAALVGLSDNSLNGAIEIPAQVSDGSTVYTVSAVKNRWGGVRFHCLLQTKMK